jgi:hypothetical protein
MVHSREVPQFMLCIRREGCDDLEVRRLYQILPDSPARKEGCIRVIDESGVDYLYPAEYFIEISLPDAIAEQPAVSA